MASEGGSLAEWLACSTLIEFDRQLTRRREFESRSGDISLCLNISGTRNSGSPRRVPCFGWCPDGIKLQSLGYCLR